MKALGHWTTGGIVAAGTTSLPERMGGSRNWDYRYCWLRDATFTNSALTGAGFLDEARAWHEWLLRAVAGSPDDVQTMYGVAGERRLDEYEISCCPAMGAQSRCVSATPPSDSCNSMFLARCSTRSMSPAAPAPGADSWALEQALVSHLETIWRDPDEGIWEVRGGPRHFTHSKVMAWVAFDRAVRSVEEFGLDGPLERWRQVRSEIHEEVCRHGFDANQNAFVQSFGATELDASCS